MIFTRRTRYLNRRLGMPILGKTLIVTAALGVSAGVVLAARGGAALIIKIAIGG